MWPYCVPGIVNEPWRGELPPRDGGGSPGFTPAALLRESCLDVVCIETKAHSTAFIQSSSYKQKVTCGSQCGWDGIFPLGPPVWCGRGGVERITVKEGAH